MPKKHAFFKFLSVGALATLIQYVLLIVFVEWLALAAALASSLGYAISALFNYWVNYHFTFDAKSNHKSTVMRFALITLLGLGLNYLLMYLLTDIFTIYYVIAQVLTTGLVFLFNYVAHKSWTYRH